MSDLSKVLTKINNSKYNNGFVESEYFDKIGEKIIIKMNDKLTKITEEIIDIPTTKNINLLVSYNYNLNHLKNFAKTYKLKVTGTKPVLLSRIYNYLYFSLNVTKIQKYIRGYLQRKYVLAHGPAYLKRNLCTNACDFLTFDEVKDIPLEQFFSYKDEDGLIYGFDLLSLNNLLFKTTGPIKNPFTTKLIPKYIIDDFKSLIRISRVLKINILTEIRNVWEDVSDKKTVELRALSLFQAIDALGNYSNCQWFLELNRNELIKFLRELIDIWNYRAPLTQQTKREICPPNGNPFHNLPSLHVLNTMQNVDDIKRSILTCLEKLVNTGINEGSKGLGAFYVLGALTLANQDAATALPWLYQAVAYI